MEKIYNNLILSISIAILLSSLLFACNYPAYISINYLATDGGYIQGVPEQTIEKGTDATSVTAIANEGYKFVRWSDGVTTAERTDSCVIKKLTVTAVFVRTAKTYQYIYSNATENNITTSIYIDDKNFYDTKFVVPQRINSIFEGWYLEKDFKTQVSDEQGNLVIDYSLFDNESANLYAKFSLIEDVTFNILMVYVTEVEGTFELSTTTEIQNGTFECIPNGERYFYYKMSDLEKQLCSLYSKDFEDHLNDLFAGWVNFEVDEYFTKNKITRANFTRGTSHPHGWEYLLLANNIPELSQEMLDNYGSVLTTVPLGDGTERSENGSGERSMHSGSGMAYIKSACIYWDSTLGPYIVNNISIEQMINNKEYRALDAYLHEFIHTIEILIYSNYILHDTMVYMDRELDIKSLFLLNKAELNGVTVGIPYNFWKNWKNWESPD